MRNTIWLAAALAAMGSIAAHAADPNGADERFKAS